MCADKVHRQQIRGELYTFEYHMLPFTLSADALCQRAGKHGLAGARVVFHKYMAAGKQAGDHKFYLFALATYHFFHLAHKLLYGMHGINTNRFCYRIDHN